jgi:[acyl-carrier-protein] S-malonyltransferase
VLKAKNKSVVIFPGQGAQYPGMGKSLYEAFSSAKEIFSSIDDILGFKLSEKCFLGSAEELKDTATQQLAILAVSLAAFTVFKTKNIEPEYLSGLSLGEYTCLYAGKVTSLKDLVQLVKARAQAMQKAAALNPSTMFAVIGIEPAVLSEKANQEGFYLANINSPQQIVISLAKDKRIKVKESLGLLGAKVIELEVSGGFHSPFMDPAKKELERVMENIKFTDSRIPIVSNVTALAHSRSSDIRNNLLNQLTSPVLWKDCVEFLINKGSQDFFEVGPSKVLKGLMRKINPAVSVTNIEKQEDLAALLEKS